MSGLYSPILAQAGFAKRKLASVIEWVAELDGATQYWQLSEPINVQNGDAISFAFTGFENIGLYKRFFGSDDFILSLDTGADGDKFRSRSLTNAYLDGVEITTETLIPVAGAHDVNCISGATKQINTLLSLESSNLVKVAMYNFKVIRNGVVIHEIHLTNKAQGATQLATVGNVNAFMPNYTDAVWKNKAELV